MTTTEVEAITWDGTKFAVGTGFGVDNALRAYVRHIMGRLDLDVSPPPVVTIDTSILWATSGPEVVPVDALPIAATGLRTSGKLIFGADLSAPASISYDIPSESIVYDAGPSSRAAGDAQHVFTGGIRADSITTDNITADNLTARDTVFIGRDMSLYRVPHLGNATAETLRLEAPSGYAMASGGVGAMLSANAYWDGELWHAFDPAAPSGDLVLLSGYLAYRVAPAGDPMTLSTPFSVGTNGLVTLPADAGITIGGRVHFGDLGSNAIIDATAQIQFRSAGGASRGSIDGAGNLYTEGQTNASYFISRTNIDIQGGAIFFAANAGINITWNGNGFQFSHYVMSGSAYYYHSNGAIWTNWDGQSILFSHQINTPRLYSQGEVYAVGRLITNNWDIGWSNNINGNCIINGIIAANGRLYTNAWDTGQPNCLGGGITEIQGETISHGGFNAYYAGASTWGFHTGNLGDHRTMGISNGWTVHSARRFKDAIEPIHNALSIVREPTLNGVTYDHIPDNDPNFPVEVRRSLPPIRHSVGFVADDWEPLVPAVVHHAPNGDVGMDYDRVGAITFQAVKELSAQVEALTARVAELEGRQPQ